MAAKKTAQTAAQDFVADAQKSVNEQTEKMGKGFEEASVFGQETLDAFTKSSEIAAKAAEGMGNDFAAYSKKSFDDGVAAAKDMAQSKTAAELFEKQAAFATQAFEGFMAQATKFGEIAGDIAKEAGAPLNAQMNAATEKMKSYSL